jgi:NADH:ubiquinone oxidoreductase subunit C
MPLISKITKKNKEISIEVKEASKGLDAVLNYVKKGTRLQYAQLMGITCEHIGKKEMRVVYMLLSVKYGKRLRVEVRTTKSMTVPSVVKRYGSAGWYEREVWDLFGVFFLKNTDLRRILTDYGFVGHPLRKDFPLYGLSQVRYDVELKRVLSEPVELSQVN